MTFAFVVSYNSCMCEQYYDVEKSLGYLTITSNRLMSAYFRKRLLDAEIDITAEQWGVLAQLWNSGKIAQDELAHIVCVEKSSLSRVLDVMERKGLVTRKKDPSDARRKILYPTKESQKLRLRCRDVAEEAMESMLRDISPGDLDTCLAVLSQVKCNLRGLQD